DYYCIIWHINAYVF
nr:immunoglobulin light chain junction region [Macaca mulatta]